MKRLIAMAVLCLLLLPAAATAGKATKRVYRAKPQVMVFTPDEVTATVRGPNGEVIKARQKSPFASMIRMRGNFLPELIKSAEDI